MKKLTYSALIIISTVMVSFIEVKLHTDVYKVDSKLSQLEWYAEKLTGKHNGTINFLKGELRDNHGSLSGSFEFDMKTIANKDMEPGESKSKFEKHLKSPDFFDVEKYPVSKFVILAVTPLQDSKPGGNTHRVKGMLTIKNKTNEISFDATISKMDNGLSCVGSAVVDRSKFDIKFRSKTFFPDVGDKMIYDEFTLKFKVVAVK